MIALLFNPIALRIAAVLAVIGVLFALHVAIEKRAQERLLSEIARANAEAARRADEGERNVLTCPPELWSRELRRCATKLP